MTRIARRFGARIPTAILLVAVLWLPFAAAHAADGTESAPADARSIERLLAVLEDDEQRARLASDLRSLLAAMPPASADAAPEAEPVAPSGSTGDLAGFAARESQRLHGFFDRLGAAFGQIETLPAWFDVQATDPQRRAFWFAILIDGLLLPLLVTLLVRWGVGLVLDSATARLRRSTPTDFGGRLFTIVARLLLEAAKVGAVLAAGYLLLSVIEGASAAYRAAEAVILAVAMMAGFGVFGRLVFSPRSDAMRWLPVSAPTAAYLHVWLLRLAAVAVGGFAVTRIGDALEINPDAVHAIRVAFAIVFTGMLAMLVMQSKQTVAGIIRGSADRAARRRFADIWHVLAILYVVLAFSVFVSGAEDGFVYLLRGTAITAAAAVGGLLASILVDRLIGRIFALDPELDARFPGLRARSTLYRPVLKRILDTLLGVIALLIALAGWKIGILEILSPELRVEILRSAATIALVLVVCVLAWELSASMIARYLADGRGEDPGSRARTLLPLLRRAILLALVIFGGLIILSEIGIDTAPLLAGAGVVGLAIGFGSQALVRDVITGLFILIEDTVAVGDVVTVGGHTGVVEDLSIRTIRLRDLAGTVHTVPFGDVTTVENLTKDFSYALLDIGVAYREDTDRVCEVLREIFEDLRADPAYGPDILDDIEILGVNELADSAVVIRARIKTRPIMQWGMRREYYRRMKKRFDELGIEIPFPHTTIYFGVDSEGRAPPAHIVTAAPSDPAGEGR